MASKDSWIFSIDQGLLWIISLNSMKSVMNLTTLFLFVRIKHGSSHYESVLHLLRTPSYTKPYTYFFNA